MKKLALTYVLAALTGSLSLGQESMDPPPQMDQLKFIVGEWEGDGWVMTGPGQREKFRVHELASMKLGGSVLYLEGRGVGVVDDKKEDEVVHQALALIHFDRAQDKFLMRAYRAGGYMTDAEVAVDDEQIIWGFKSPQGLIRYSLRLNEKDQWFEIGEISMDGGQNYLKFFEMKLDRIAKSE